MTGKLTDFALRLSQNPSDLTAFQSSPEAAEAAMVAAGLSEHERAVMLGGDQRAIGDALAAESRVAASTDEAMEAPTNPPVQLPPIEIPPIDVPVIEPMESPLIEPMEAPPVPPNGLVPVGAGVA